MRHIIRIALFALALTNVHCAHSNKSGDKVGAPTTGPAAAAPSANLPIADAEARAAIVSDVSYDLIFDLSADKSDYTGKAKLKFRLKEAPSKLRVDFYQGKVNALLVNGQKADANYDGAVLWLAGSSGLVAGENLVEIDFTREFPKQGDGLYRFQDPEDKRVYVYTDLEPFDANKVFPCFDQPDLKATYRMSVSVPADWQVISSVRESRIAKAGKDRRLWLFPESERFSTYVWSLHAGPYKMWEKKGPNNINMRLFSRQTLAKYVDANEWFTTTAQGLRFFPEFFGYHYPYKKYDQILAPDFNSGAMENVAAVTFNERFLSRGKKSRLERAQLAETLLHEMAHMWFGDLVTMKWWNDLWLNESFATYMATLAMVEGTTEFKDNWRKFQRSKQWAYWEDQLVTTHPIEAKVPDTLQAFANFDGITYGKGASVLKQMHFYLGRDAFRAGIRDYFQKHAGKNTVLADFTGALATASGRDLHSWEDSWLRTSGVDTVSPVWTCEGGKVASFRIEQTPQKDQPALRPHRMRIAFFQNQGKDGLKVASTYDAYTEGKATELKELVGRACPDAVFPNFEDHAYMKVSLDEKSLDAFRGRIAGLSDPFSRQLVWNSLWQMVEDAKFDVAAFFELAMKSGIARETDEYNLRQLLGNMASSLGYLRYADDGEGSRFRAKLGEYEDFLWKKVRAAKPGSELQRIWYDNFVTAAESPAALANLRSVLVDETKLAGLTIDQDKRWNIIGRLSRAGFAGAEDLIAAEEKRDPSNFGRTSAAGARASLPSWEAKERWLAEFRSGSSAHTFAVQRSAMQSLFPQNQKSLRERHAESFFQELSRFNSERDPLFVSAYTTLSPDECQNPAQAGRILRYLNTVRLIPRAEKSLRVDADEGERCRKIVELTKNSAAPKSTTH